MSVRWQTCRTCILPGRTSTILRSIFRQVCALLSVLFLMFHKLTSMPFVQGMVANVPYRRSLGGCIFPWLKSIPELWAEWNDSVLPFPKPLDPLVGMVELLYEYMTKLTYKEWWWAWWEHNVHIRLDLDAQLLPNWWGCLVSSYLYYAMLCTRLMFNFDQIPFVQVGCLCPTCLHWHS